MCLLAIPGRGGVVPCSQKGDKATRAPPAHNPPLPPNSERDKEDKRGLTHIGTLN